mgnify:FL=1
MKRINKFKSKNINNLTIFKRDDSKSSSWYGCFNINGKEKIKSSESANKRQSVKILEDWCKSLIFKVQNNLPITNSTIENCLDEYLKYVKNSIQIESSTKRSIKGRFNQLKKCKSLMKLNVAKCKPSNINDTYLVWKLKQKSQKGKVYRGATIKGELITLTGFFTWCFEKGLRSARMGGLIKLLPKDMRQQVTSRTTFTKNEILHLQKVSRERYKNGYSERIRFNQEKLHHFINFMCGTGMRVDECMSIHFEDITPIDRGHQYKHDDDRYYLKINLRKSKIKKYREVISMSSAYFAYKRLIKLYTMNNIDINGNIWKIDSFRTGLNALLKSSGLKTKMVGGIELTRDAKSFRNFYIISRIQQGVPHNIIAKNCGTSTEMIDKHYSVYQQMTESLHLLLQTERSKQSKLKVVK